jgi:hypothetical protein
MLYGCRGVATALKIRGSSDRTFTNEPLFSWFLGAAQRNVRLTPFYFHFISGARTQASIWKWVVTRKLQKE